MLSEIYIRNYLFVPEARIAFQPGMTVITGETGAGKSILVGSIALIFAENTYLPEALDPTQNIYLEAEFDISANPEVLDHLKEIGYTPEGALTIAREVTPNGKTTYFLDGRKVAAAVVRELKPYMIDFHHQRDQQRLLSASYQLDILDIYAGTMPLREEFAILLRKLKTELKNLQQMRDEEERNKQLAELYQFQLSEYEQADLKVGEDTALQQEYDLLNHAREITDASISIANDLIESDDSVYDRINRAVSFLDKFSGLNERIDQVRQSLTDCLEIISDSSTELSDIVGSMDHDPQRLLDLQNRLDLVNNLAHKHRVRSIGELVDLFAERRAQVDSFADLSQTISALDKAIISDFNILKEKAEELSKVRRKAAKGLSTELVDAIARLSIPEARFEISIDKKADNELLMHEYLAVCSESGADACAYLFCANRGSALKALSAVASGGELSRILLALKKVLAERIPPKLMILDEIDAGIGGKTAEAVAEFIVNLATEHRIMCITHLAQIAAAADTHIALEKSSTSAGTRISINVLSPKQRPAELARMLSGGETRVSLDHAMELIDKYNKVRN